MPVAEHQDQTAVKQLHPCVRALYRLGFVAMFDTITAEITTATDKLAHLRRFL